MKNEHSQRWRTCAYGLCAAVAISAAPGVARAQEQVEEVVVTGSYIRRGDSFDTATPVEVLDREDLESIGQSDFGQVLRNQSFNYGVDAAENILGGTPATGAFSQANLRGLGAGATLTLLDGRRTASPNVQSLYPSIMVERVETLTDGASTIYGSDAVAGVVNLIPRRDFRGFEIGAQQNNADDWDETTWSVIAGTGGDRTSIVTGLSYRERSQLQFLDRPEFAEAGITSSEDSPTGNYLVPTRNAAGELTGNAPQIPDPGCGVGAGTAFPADKTEPGNFITGRNAAGLGQCRREFAEDFNYISPQEVFQGMALVEHRFSDSLRFEGEVLFSHQNTDTRGSASNPGGQLSRLPVVPGTHPGNPFRAQGAGGNPLFAFDANGDGVPDRQAGMDANGNGLNDFAVAGADGSATGPNGNPVVPFSEDVRISRWRPIGKITNPQPLRTNSDGSGEGDFTFEQDNFRWAGRLTLDIPETSWSVYADYLFHQSTFQQKSRIESLSAIQAGLVGDLNFFDNETNQPVSGAFFNPFSTQRLTCENRQCAITDDPDLPNEQEVVDRIATQDNSNVETTLTTQEIVATGDVFDLPGGPFRAAVGAQRRYLSVDADFGGIGNSRDAFIPIQVLDYAENRETWAGFAELNVPIFNNATLGAFDLNVAGRIVRANDDSQADLDTEIFKASVRWEPRPWVALRGSVGEAFIAPSIEELFEPATFALSNVTDPLTGGASAFKARGVGGNPELEPETSDQFNVGVTMRLLDDDLTLSADYHFFDFSDRIVRPIPQDVVDRDSTRFSALCNATDGVCGAGPFEGLTTDPGVLDFDQAEEQFLLNNPTFDNNPAATARRNRPDAPGESDNVIRGSESLVVERFRTPLINATSQKWKGVDYGLTYRFEGSDVPFFNLGDIGLFTVGIQGTWVHEYTTQASADAEAFDAVGKRNADTGFVPPIPEFQSTAQFGWALGRHQVTIYGRWQSKVEEDDNLCLDVGGPSVPDAFNGFIYQQIGSQVGCPDEIPAKTLWDVQYDLNLDSMFFDNATTRVQVGIINAFDTLPPSTAQLGGIDPFLYDPRGRQFYARLRVGL